jgi:hypothetical protein
MGYVGFCNNESVEFHVGLPLHYIEPANVTFVQLDGDELEKVYQIIPSFHITNNRVVRFYGDIAKFIIYNVFMK